MRVLVRPVISVLRRLLAPHDGKDNSNYWRYRARSPGSTAVLWENAAYNSLVRAREHEFLRPHILSLPRAAKVLDVGCGIGEVTRMLLDVRPDLRITAVDFPEMIDRARQEQQDLSAVEWVGMGAEEFVRRDHFDLVLSSACYSAIRDRNKCVQAIRAGCASVNAGGLLVMIDPFHRSKYLARARIHPREVIRIVRIERLELLQHGGMLFWPFRELIANSSLGPEQIERWFHRGERLLGLLGERVWSDYKTFVFRKTA